MNVSSIDINLRMKNKTIILVQLKYDYPFTIEEIKVECDIERCDSKTAGVQV